MERDFIDLKKNYTLLSAEMQSKSAENDELRKEVRAKPSLHYIFMPMKFFLFYLFSYVQ